MISLKYYLDSNEKCRTYYNPKSTEAILLKLFLNSSLFF